MADKKITIKPADMERLRELMRQEEEKLDAANPSDAELNQWERQLDESLRGLAQKTPDTVPPRTEEMDRNWTAILEKMRQVPTAAAEHQKPATVLPLARPLKSKALPFLGLAAAAALMFILVRPQASEDRLTMNEQNVQIKGTTEQLMAADCELDVAGLGSSHVKPAADGKGFVGKPGVLVEVSFRCSSSGFMRVALQGPDSLTFQVPVSSGVRQTIIRDGQVARFPLQSDKPWVINLILMNKELSKDSAVPQDHVLWQDTISVGASE